MSRKKRKTRARRRDQRTDSRLDTIVTQIETKERVIIHAPFLKLVGIGLPFPEGGSHENG